MDANIAEQVQLFDPGQLIELFSLDATALGGGVYYFTSSAYATEDVAFDGQDYTPIDIEASGFEYSGRGSLPTPTLRMNNATLVLMSAVNTYNDLLGATLTRTRTFKQFLDGESEADPTAFFPKDIYKIEQKVTLNKVFIEWRLSAALDQEGRILPGRQVLKDTCLRRYRFFDPNTGDFTYTQATCPYVGGAYFDVNGNVSGISGDKCGKKLSDCQLRFGQFAALPTNGFPGVSQVT